MKQTLKLISKDRKSKKKSFIGSATVSQSYQDFAFLFTKTQWKSSSVCSKTKKYIHYKMTLHSSKKWKNYAFTKKFFLVRLALAN